MNVSIFRDGRIHVKNSRVKGLTKKYRYIPYSTTKTCWFSLEAPRRDASNEYLQYIFAGKYENIYLDTPLIWNCVNITLAELWADSADDTLEIFFLFFLENRI